MDAKDEVKQRLSVEEVIGDYLELKRAGRNFKAISPFTSEKTPSFMISPEKQIWHDFSSNKGGDIFTFVMEIEGVEFREALEILARKANVDLALYQKGDGKTAQLKKRLLEAHKQAAAFYHLCLSRQPDALAYVKETRHFTTETIRTWQLGYSPNDGQSLYRFLTKRGFSEVELSKAGLITKRRSGWGDMFRGRIMIPLADGVGNVVGFTARLLKEDKSAPKYFNTPGTLIYDKGRQVFGLHHAKDSIRKADNAVLVEGNLDVIASHQAKVNNVVAAAGTAMTADHLRSLSRLTNNIYLAFDADQAGINATERAIFVAQNVGVDLKVVSLPDNIKDPDELIQTDPKKWQKIINQATDAITWTLAEYEKHIDKTTAEGKRLLSDKALAIIRNLHDPVEREHHLNQLASLLNVSIESLQNKLQQQKTRSTAKKPIKTEAVDPDATAYEDRFLALNAGFNEVRDSLKQISSQLLHGKQRQEFLEQLKNLPIGQTLQDSDLNELHLNEDYVKILLFIAQEEYASWSPADLMAETMALARRIILEAKKQQQIELTEAIARAEDAGEHEKAAKLLAEYQQLLAKSRNS